MTVTAKKFMTTADEMKLGFDTVRFPHAPKFVSEVFTEEFSKPAGVTRAGGIMKLRGEEDGGGDGSGLFRDKGPERKTDYTTSKKQHEVEAKADKERVKSNFSKLKFAIGSAIKGRSLSKDLLNVTASARLDQKRGAILLPETSREGEGQRVSFGAGEQDEIDVRGLTTEEKGMKLALLRKGVDNLRMFKDKGIDGMVVPSGSSSSDEELVVAKKDGDASRTTIQKPPVTPTMPDGLPPATIRTVEGSASPAAAPVAKGRSSLSGVSIRGSFSGLSLGLGGAGAISADGKDYGHDLYDGTGIHLELLASQNVVDVDTNLLNALSDPKSLTLYLMEHGNFSKLNEGALFNEKGDPIPPPSSKQEAGAFLSAHMGLALEQQIQRMGTIEEGGLGGGGGGTRASLTGRGRASLVGGAGGSPTILSGIGGAGGGGLFSSPTGSAELAGPVSPAGGKPGLKRMSSSGGGGDKILQMKNPEVEEWRRRKIIEPFHEKLKYRAERMKRSLRYVDEDEQEDAMKALLEEEARQVLPILPRHIVRVNLKNMKKDDDDGGEDISKPGSLSLTRKQPTIRAIDDSLADEIVVFEELNRKEDRRANGENVDLEKEEKRGSDQGSSSSSCAAGGAGDEPGEDDTDST